MLLALNVASLIFYCYVLFWCCCCVFVLLFCFLISCERFGLLVSFSTLQPQWFSVLIRTMWKPLYFSHKCLYVCLDISAHRLRVCTFPAAGEHQVCLHAEIALSCFHHSLHGLHQASVETFLDPVRQEIVRGGSPLQKKKNKLSDRSQAQLSERSLQVRIDPDLLIQRPVEPLLSPTAKDCRLAKVDVQQERVRESHVFAFCNCENVTRKVWTTG